MELLYLYIEKFNGIIEKQEINFSPNFHVKIEDEKLVVKQKESFMNELYPAGIRNITMLLGKNGAGKTTTLDMLGMNWDDRCNFSIKRKGRSRSEVVDSYFIMYHIEGDYYGIEVMDEIDYDTKGTKLFKSTLTNFNFDKIENPFYKIPMGLVVKKSNDSFEVVEHFFDKYSLGYKVSDRIGVNYISENHSERLNIKYNFIGKDEENYETEGYLCKRRYYINPSKKRQYEFLNYLNKDKDLYFCGSFAAIEISPDFDYAVESGTINQEMEKWIDTLEETLYIDKSDRINISELLKDEQSNEKTKKGNKQKKYKNIFILDTLSSCIIHQFIKGSCEMIDNGRIGKNSVKEVSIDLSNSKHIEFLNNLKKEEYKQSNSESLLGTLSNKELEYENLIKVINYFKKDTTLKIYDKLICITRYLYSRMESSIDLGSDSKYQIATEEFLNGLSYLKESYFRKKAISIGCNLDIDEDVIKVLQIHDYYLYNKYNDIQMRFKIKFSNLSEGEKNFLDLLSKIFDIVKKTPENQLSIILLDEPDRALHPEWSRRFIKFLCDEIVKYENKSIQIVIATHAPYMATDIMSEHIYCLEHKKDIEISNPKNKGESKIIIYPMTQKKDKVYNTFGANIYDILKDSFILEKTIGAFSYDRITKLIESLKADPKDYTIEYEKFLIESIGEPVLRKKLERIYVNKREKEYCDLKDDLLRQIKTETNPETLNKIKKILRSAES